MTEGVCCRTEGKEGRKDEGRPGSGFVRTRVLRGDAGRKKTKVESVKSERRRVSSVEIQIQIASIRIPSKSGELSTVRRAGGVSGAVQPFAERRKIKSSRPPAPGPRHHPKANSHRHPIST